MNYSTEHELLLANEFSGDTQQLLQNRYGDPRKKGWAKQWLYVWKVKNDFSWFPSATLYIHRHFYPKLKNAFIQLEQKGLHSEIKTLDEDYNIRYIHGSTYVLSLHSWGAAVDMNAVTNSLGSSGTWSKSFIDIMIQNDICCGQTWTGRKDPMHFAMING